RDDPRAAPRPGGRHQPLRLHRGGEARDREALPRPEAARGARARARPGPLRRPGAPAHDPRVHARGWRPQPRAPDRGALPHGGDVLFVEATGYPGKGRLTVTGQLGEVMQESAQAALSWVRSHAVELGLDPTWFADHDVHVHVPAGAVPKDGPSAGITMATAI